MFNPEKMTVNEKTKAPLEETEEVSFSREEVEGAAGQESEAAVMLNKVREQEENLAEAEDRPKAGRLKKAIIGITAGLMLFSSSADFALGREKEYTRADASRAQAAEVPEKESKPAETQKLEEQMRQLEEKLSVLRQEEARKEKEQRLQEREGWLAAHFNIAGLKLGEPKVGLRCPCEQFGLYLSSQHLSDIYSEGRVFTEEEFIAKTGHILEQRGVLEKEKRKAEFVVDSDQAAQKIMKKWGAKVEGDVFSTKKKSITFDIDTERVEFKGAGDNVLMVTIFDKKETGGKITIINFIDGDIVITYEHVPQRRK